MDQAISKIKRVVYLIGAGATHASALARGSTRGIQMDDLKHVLLSKAKILIEQDPMDYGSAAHVLNTMMDDDADVEQIITFLEESPSELYRRLADIARKAFISALQDRLNAIADDLSETPFYLYTALLDMYNVKGIEEELAGIITINYDEYIESAIAEHGQPLDLGVALDNESYLSSTLKLIKLHGSLGWQDVWPILRSTGDSPLWIPLGIQKAKGRYPFNLLWGLARELLDCDLLRIIGVRLGPNDWDLISLLFTTQHTNRTRSPYDIEMIDEPQRAADLQGDFPYLGVRSVLEVEPMGSQLIAELTEGPERAYSDLSDIEKREILKTAEHYENWFRRWLQRKAEALRFELGSIETPLNAFQNLMVEY